MKSQYEGHQDVKSDGATPAIEKPARGETNMITPRTKGKRIVGSLESRGQNSATITRGPERLTVRGESEK